MCRVAMSLTWRPRYPCEQGRLSQCCKDRSKSLHQSHNIRWYSYTWSSQTIQYNRLTRMMIMRTRCWCKCRRPSWQDSCFGRRLWRISSSDIQTRILEISCMYCHWMHRCKSIHSSHPKHSHLLWLDRLASCTGHRMRYLSRIRYFQENLRER